MLGGAARSHRCGIHACSVFADDLDEIRASLDSIRGQVCGVGWRAPGDLRAVGPCVL